MSNSFNEAIDRLDAEVFSGDALFDPKNRKSLRSVLARWTRALEEHEDEDIPSPESINLLLSENIDFDGDDRRKLWIHAASSALTVERGTAKNAAILADQIVDEYTIRVQKGRL